MVCVIDCGERWSGDEEGVLSRRESLASAGQAQTQEGILGAGIRVWRLVRAVCTQCVVP